MRSRFGNVRGAHTAIHRSGPSGPLRWLLKRGLVRGSVLDYGCGRGEDVRYLRRLGFDAEGWDPAHAPDPTPLARRYDTVLCTYVLNVLDEDEALDAALLARQRVAPSGQLFVAVRRDLYRQSSVGDVQTHVTLEQPLLVENKDFAIYRVDA